MKKPSRRFPAWTGLRHREFKAEQLTGRVFLRLLALGMLVALVAINARGWPVPGRVKPGPVGPGAVIGYGGSGRELDTLGPVWYLDYEFASPTWQNHPRLYFVQLSNSLQEVARVARQYRGEWWTLGNEPNDPNQDNIPPEAYVRPYHDLFYTLKAADPQARLMPTGVANADWRWLDQWREAYRKVYGRYPPVDGWRFHDYLLETCEGAMNTGEFERRALEFRGWVAKIGDAAKPVFLTEYGSLYGNGCCSCPRVPSEDLILYMQSTTHWLMQSRVVTAWAWWAVDSGDRFNGDLFRQGELLPTGKAYRELIDEWKAGP